MITWLRIMVWFALKCRLYYFWSKIYQDTAERWAKKIVLPEYESLEELELTLGNMKWVADGILELGDAIGGPKATWFKYVKNAKTAKDCDEFALFAADRLENLKKRGKLGREVETIGILSCPWHGEKGTGGHNVCAFSYKDGEQEKWAHVGNWYKGKTQWGFSSLNRVVIDVCGSNTSVGYGLANSRLKLITYKSKT